MKKIILLTVSLIFSTIIFAQDNVGIGTLTPNANAILDLEADDKGLLIPRLTTAERTALNPGFGAAETGMLVFDTNDTLFYFWDGTAWIAINGSGINTDDQNLTLSNDTLFIEDGNFVVITDDVNDADFDPTNELQDLAVVGDSILINGGTSIALSDITTTTISNDSLLIINGDTINLAAAAVGSDDQNLTISNDTLFIEDGNFIVLPSGVASTDDQNLSISGDTLLLEDGGFVLLQNLTSTNLFNDSILVINGDTVNLSTNDADFDPTNELQDLTVLGDSILINGGTSIALSDITNTSISNDSLLIINGDTINLAAAAVGSDDQALTISNDTLFLEDGGFVVLPSGVASTDDQNLSISGDTLLLEDGGFVLLQNLTTTNLFNDSVLVINGDTVNLSTNDADFDPTNELQDLTVLGDSILITGGTSIALSDITNTTISNDSLLIINGDTINLAAAAVGTDNQTLSILGDQLTIADGNTITLPDNVNDADADSTNELQDLSVLGDSLIINGGTNVFLGDLTSTAIINDTTLIINGDTLTLPSGGAVNTDDQALTISNDTIFLEDGGFVELPSSAINNTLDQAYDEGGPGVGREILATDGAVLVNGTDGLYVTGTFGSGSVVETAGAGTRMFFNPNKAAFRAGNVDGVQFDNANVGNYSTAFGRNNIASGVGSTAFGEENTASGTRSTASGEGTIASNTNATTFGEMTNASGVHSFATGDSTVASQYATTAMGIRTVASGSAAVSSGFETVSSGIYSNASGDRSIATGYAATAGGWQTNSSGTASTAFGANTLASGDNSTAIGVSSEATGNTSTAIGSSTTASGGSSLAIGNGSEASGDISFATGLNTVSSGYASTAIGRENVSSGNHAFTSGIGLVGQAYNEIALGMYNDTVLAVNNPLGFDGGDRIFNVGHGASDATRSNALTILKNGNSGFGNNANNPTNLVHINNGNIDPLRIENLDTDATLDTLLVMDAAGIVHKAAISDVGLASEFVNTSGVTHNTTDINTADFVFGATTIDNQAGTADNNKILFDKSLGSFRAGGVSTAVWDQANMGNYSFASGFNTDASGNQSFASGDATTASGAGATAMGFQTIASGFRSTAIGDSSIASGYTSVATGQETVSSGTASTAMGFQTNASGIYSFASGFRSISSNTGSTAMGYETNATGPSSTALGYGSTASGSSSIAMGFFSTASGLRSFASGEGSRASSSLGYAMGWNTIANSFGETVIGTFNDTATVFNATAANANDKIFSIGNGGSNATRSNAVVVLKNGNTGIGSSTPQANLHVESQNLVGDAEIIIEADRDNNNEQDNPVLTLIQDGGLVTGAVGLEGNAGTKATNTLGNALVIESSTTVQVVTGGAVRTTVAAGGNVGIGVEAPTQRLDVAGAVHITQVTGAPAPNVVYGNSTPLAYAISSPTGTIVGVNYGVTSVTNSAVGQYTVVLNNAWTGQPVISANLYDANSIGFINCFANANTNTLTIYTFNGTGVPANRQVSFVVHGTPQ